MKELIKERGLWIAVLITIAGLAAGIPFYEIKPPLGTGSFLEVFRTALSSKVLIFLIPVTAVLPMGAVFVRESSGGFLRVYLTRTSRMEYIRRKVLQIYAGGFLTFFSAGLLVLLLSFLFLYPLEIKGDMMWDGLLNALKMLLRISLIAGILSEIAGIFAAAFQNYYMAYGLPFVTYYMLIILKERYFADMYAMYPAEWVKCEQDWGAGGLGIWMFLVTFSVGTVLLNGLIMNYRLEEI